MPTYEYKCNNCGHDFEAFQSMKDEKLKVCPACGKESLSRLIGTGGGLIFKGSGFYLTDYKNPAAKESGSDKSKESKPVIKTESETKTSTDKTETSTVKPAASETGTAKNTSAKSES